MVRAPFQILVIPFRKTTEGRLEVAVFHRTDDGNWQFIAGGGEDDEPPAQAAKREALEEAGIPVSRKYFLLQSKDYVPVSEFTGRDHWPRALDVIPEHYFAVETAGLEIALSAEHTEFRWASCEEARALLRWDGNKTALWELGQRLATDDMPQPI